MESLKQSFVKLNPRVMIKNPIMFTVEVVTVVMLIVCFLSLGTSEYGAFGYNLLVFIILFVTLLFANFAEAIAEAAGTGTAAGPGAACGRQQLHGRDDAHGARGDGGAGGHQPGRISSAA